MQVGLLFHVPYGQGQLREGIGVLKGLHPTDIQKDVLDDPD